MIDNIINDFYDYHIKWNKELINDYYKDKLEYRKVYLKIINNNPYSLYEYIIGLYNELLFNNDLNNDLTIKQFNELNDLLFKTVKFIRSNCSSK